MLLVITTLPKDKAKEVIRTLLEERLIACANFFEVQSMYWWDEKIEETNEVLVLMKTRDEYYDRLEDRLKQLHPYEVPEIIAIRVENALAEYERWVDKVTRRKL